MLHSQTIAWFLVQTRFAVEARELAAQMILAANAGPRVLNADHELGVDPWDSSCGQSSVSSCRYKPAQ
jgi:hypothetical protein